MGSVATPQHFVRIVAVQARQRPGALLKAPAFPQVRRLMPGVPGVLPIDGAGIALGEPVAGPAHAVQIVRRERFRVSDQLPRCGQIAVARADYVAVARSVAGLAADAGFCNPDLMDRRTETGPVEWHWKQL